MIGVSDVKQHMQGKPKPEMPGSWILPGVNPLSAEYMRPENTQSPQPEFKGNMLPVYVPMTAKDKIHGDKPVHNAELLTRNEYLNAQLTEDTRDANIASAYKTYFLAWVCLGLTIATYFIHPYVAAVFAYLSGHYWAWKELGVSWGREWYKGKMLIYTS
ncbi:MAG: hypothetical protein NTY90_01080 [Candidatus Micrarchaeota archaeon]|nr:hypothetical protein [Candidatus Micrarchaeota archaeon]